MNISHNTMGKRIEGALAWGQLKASLDRPSGEMKVTQGPRSRRKERGNIFPGNYPRSYRSAAPMGEGKSLIFMPNSSKDEY